MNKYTSHEIQNSILKVMATYILRDIYESIKLSPFITVMMNEATDISNKSALRRVKTYLRGTMLQGRLSNLMVLHVHHHRTDLLNLKEVANEFVSDCEHRLRIFWKILTS